MELPIGPKYTATSKNFNCQEFCHFLSTDTSLLKVIIPGGCLNLRGDDVRLLADALRTNTTLEKLNLIGNKFSPNHIRQLASGLSENTTLKKLSLYGCIGRHSILLGLVDVNIEHLSLNFCHLTAEDIRTVLSNNNLTSLNLDRSYFYTVECITVVAEALMNNKLTKLNLSFGSELEPIYQALHTNTSLECLHLAYANNNFDLLIDALKVNTTLKKLDLSGTFCEDDDFVRLMQCNLQALYLNLSAVDSFLPLKDNTTIVDFKYTVEVIGEEEINALIAVILENRTLRKICIGDNLHGFDDEPCLPEALIGTLPEAFRNNNTLEEFNFCPMEITDTLADRFMSSLEANYTLRQITGCEVNAKLETFLSDDLRNKRYRRSRTKSARSN